MAMTGDYNRAFREHPPHAQVIFDRFPVQRLAGHAVDAVRRAEVAHTPARAPRIRSSAAAMPCSRALGT
jgi:transposase